MSSPAMDIACWFPSSFRFFVIDPVLFKGGNHEGHVLFKSDPLNLIIDKRIDEFRTFHNIQYLSGFYPHLEFPN